MIHAFGCVLVPVTLLPRVACWGIMCHPRLLLACVAFPCVHRRFVTKDLVVVPTASGFIQVLVEACALPLPVLVCDCAGLSGGGRQHGTPNITVGSVKSTGHRYKLNTLCRSGTTHCTAGFSDNCCVPR